MIEMIAVEEEKLQELLDMVGLSRHEFNLRRVGAFVDFDRCPPDSQLGKYISKIRNTTCGSVSSCGQATSASEE